MLHSLQSSAFISIAKTGKVVWEADKKKIKKEKEKRKKSQVGIEICWRYLFDGSLSSTIFVCFFLRNCHEIPGNAYGEQRERTSELKVMKSNKKALCFAKSILKFQTVS